MKIILGTHAYTKRKKRINGTLSLQDDRHTGIIMAHRYNYYTIPFFLATLRKFSSLMRKKKSSFHKKIEKSFFKFHQYKKLTQI